MFFDFAASDAARGCGVGGSAFFMALPFSLMPLNYIAVPALYSRANATASSTVPSVEAG